MESRDSGYRNPWNDSGINLPDDETNNGLPIRFDSKIPLTTVPLDSTPKHEARPSFDCGRPASSYSLNGYPAPIGPPR